MKRNVFNIIVSILLILASLAALGAGGFGVVECYALKTAKDELSTTLEPIDQMDEAIALLAENEDAYFDGWTACYTGDSQLLQGRQKIAEGQDVIDDGKLKMADAQAQYDEAEAQLNDAKAQYNEAAAKMEESRPEYEEGKEMVAKLEQIQPLVDTYANFKSGVLDGIPGFPTVDAWFVAVVIPQIAALGLELPEDIEAFSVYMDEQIATANAMLAEYEAAEAQLNEAKAQIDEADAKLAEAKAQLDQGYSVLDEGAAQLKNAESQLDYASYQLAEGKATLEEYEEAVSTVGEAIVSCMNMESICDKNGNVAVLGVAERLDKDFDIYKYNEYGEILAMQNGEPRLDYDKCAEVSQACRDYIADYGEDLGREALIRFILDCLLIAAAILGIVAAILALKGKAVSATLGIVLVSLLAALNIYGIIAGYTSFAHPQGETTYQGVIPNVGLWLMTIVALLFMAAVLSGRKKARALAAAAPVPAEAPKATVAAASVKPAAKVQEQKVAVPAAPAAKPAASPAAAESAEPAAPPKTPEEARNQARREYEEALRKYKAMRNKM